MIYGYAKAIATWAALFPLLFVFNTGKAFVDYVIWMFDLPTSVWQVCVLINTPSKEVHEHEDNI